MTGSDRSCVTVRRAARNRKAKPERKAVAVETRRDFFLTGDASNGSGDRDKHGRSVRPDRWSGRLVIELDVSRCRAGIGREQGLQARRAGQDQLPVRGRRRVNNQRGGGGSGVPAVVTAVTVETVVTPVSVPVTAVVPPCKTTGAAADKSVEGRASISTRWRS